MSTGITDVSSYITIPDEVTVAVSRLDATRAMIEGINAVITAGISVPKEK